MLPQIVEPRRLAKANQKLAGKMPIADLCRLSSLLLNTEGMLTAELIFQISCQKQIIIKGKIRARLSMCCQRCMQPMELPVDIGLNILVVRNEREALQADSYYEPLIVEDEKIETKTIIEEELLLACPIVPKHNNKVCCANNDRYEIKLDDTSKLNPFKILQDLKINKQEY